MPPQPLRPTFCSFLYPFVFRNPQSLLHPGHVRHAGGQTFRAPRMRQRPINDQTIPHDLGLMEGTFVMPQKPSIFSSPIKRVRLYGHRLYKMYEGCRMMISYKWGIKKPRPKLAYAELRKTARDYHKKMYTALSEGDKATLENICCEGLSADFSHRIAQQGENIRWTLHKYKGLTRVVSTRASMLPMIDKSALRQHVVRIKSVQSLDRLTKKGETKDQDKYAAGKPTRMVEYLVMQRRILKGKEGPWKIWGTVQETDAKDVLKDTERKGSVPQIDVKPA